MAQIMRSDQQIVEQAVQAAWEQCLLEQQADWVVFDRRRMEAQPVELRRHLLRRAIAHQQPGLREVDYASVQRALAYLEQPSPGGQCDLTGGMRLLLEQDRVWVADWKANLPDWGWPQIDEAVSWNMAEPLLLPSGWRLDASWVAGAEFDLAGENANPFQAFLDGLDADAVLEVRPRRAGDRYQPLGMESGSLKVSDYMINQKIPRRARGGWRCRLRHAAQRGEGVTGKHDDVQLPHLAEQAHKLCQRWRLQERLTT